MSFRNTYNVRYKRFLINTILLNTQPIKFFVPPRMVVSEIIRGTSWTTQPADSDTILIDVTGTGDMSGMVKDSQQQLTMLENQI